MLLAEKKSTHRVEVVPVVLHPHHNADKLSIVQVYGYTCVVNTKDWEGIDKAAFLPPDSLVDVKRPEFSWLAEKANADGLARIKAVRLRGVPSFGLLVPAMDATLGEDIAEQLGVTRYEPPTRGEGGTAGGPPLFTGDVELTEPDVDCGPYYDIDSFERNAQAVLIPGEPIEISEKIDGANVRYVFHKGRFWVKSRTRWVKEIPDFSHVTVEFLVEKGIETEKAEKIVAGLKNRGGKVNEFWAPLNALPKLKQFLQDFPDTIVFGEVFGNTHRLKYGAQQFRAFDIYKDGRFLDTEECALIEGQYQFPWVPIYLTTNYTFEGVKVLSEGKSWIPGTDTIREGVVVRPIKERWVRGFGRVILKCVNIDFIALK